MFFLQDVYCLSRRLKKSTKTPLLLRHMYVLWLLAVLRQLQILISNYYVMLISVKGMILQKIKNRVKCLNAENRPVAVLQAVCCWAESS
jgi:hypothetical protein